MKTSSQAFDQLIRQARSIDSNTVIKIIPPGLPPAAYYGLIGRILRAVEHLTEATATGILAHLAVALCALIGPGPHVFAGSRQPARLFAVVVGPTSAGRKGTAAAVVDLLMEKVDQNWNEKRASGLTSGEGLIERVTDKWETDDDGKKTKIPIEKRCYCVEPELSRVLEVCERQGNTLNPVVRDAFDSGNLSTMTVNPRNAEGAHVNIVGHITPEELAARLNSIDIANGFANRFLWLLSISDKVISRPVPFPSNLFNPFLTRLRKLLELGESGKNLAVVLNNDAQALWDDVYPTLREDQLGLAGALLARGASMVLRLSLLYCLVEKWEKENVAPQIERAHLEAALAVWSCCEQSVEQLFSSRGREGGLAQKLLALLEDGPMTKSELNDHLSEKQKKEAPRALAELVKEGVVKRSERKQKGAGRPSQVWELIG